MAQARVPRRPSIFINCVVVKDHPRRRMSHFQGELRCVLMFGEVIGSDRMSKAVIRPSRETDGVPERFNVGMIISSLGRVNRP